MHTTVKFAIRDQWKRWEIGLLLLISVPSGWGLTFSSYSKRLATAVFTPDEFHKIFACLHPSTTKEIGDVCTQAIKYGSYPWRIWVLWKIKLHPQRIPYFLTPKEILNFYNLPLENSMVPQPGEVQILNAIAHSIFRGERFEKKAYYECSAFSWGIFHISDEVWELGLVLNDWVCMTAGLHAWVTFDGIDWRSERPEDQRLNLDVRCAEHSEI